MNHEETLKQFKMNLWSHTPETEYFNLKDSIVKNLFVTTKLLTFYTENVTLLVFQDFIQSISSDLIVACLAVLWNFHV